MARPKKTLCPETVEKLAELDCTEEEMASFFGVNVETFRHRKQEESEFSAALQRGRAAGNISLRRAQTKTALSGNATMLIWLGKQRLGQKDTSTVQHGGDPDNRAPILVAFEDNLLRSYAPDATEPTPDDDLSALQE